MKSCKVSIYLWSELYLLQGLSIYPGLTLVSFIFCSFHVGVSSGEDVGWQTNKSQSFMSAVGAGLFCPIWTALTTAQGQILMSRMRRSGRTCWAGRRSCSTLATLFDEAPPPQIVELIPNPPVQGQPQTFHITQDGEEVPAGVTPIQVFEVSPGEFRPVAEVLAEAQQKMLHQ